MIKIEVKVGVCGQTTGFGVPGINIEGGFALFGDLGFGTFKVGIWGFSVLSLGFGIGICPFLNWDLGI